MLFFVIVQGVPLILLVTLAGALYLVWVDIKDEPGLEFAHKLWWFLLVLIFHVPGYLIFRIWLAARRHRRKDESHPTTRAPRGRRGGGRA